MANESLDRSLFSLRRASAAIAIGVAVALTGCATEEGMRKDAHDIAAKMPPARPVTRVTPYQQSLTRLGEMLEVYRTRRLLVQTATIADSTGTAMSSGGEIPVDITEMIRSAINRIGSQVIYVPFNPNYVSNNVAIGAKIGVVTPDVIVSGAITEFDRGLGAATKQANAGGGFGKGMGSVDINAANKGSAAVSRITLDLNMMRFSPLTAIPRMQAINTVEVFNDTVQREINFAIYGTGIGYSDSARAVQGRHDAVRLLVDLSVLELVGRFLAVPYWRTVPQGKPDEFVVDYVRKYYRGRSRADKNKDLQEVLAMWGFPTKVDGELTPEAIEALKVIGTRAGVAGKDIYSEDFYEAAYLRVPLPWEGAEPLPFKTAAPAAPTAAPAPTPSTVTVPSNAVVATTAPTTTLPTARPIVLKVETVSKNRPLSAGEQVQLVVSPAEDAYVYCYLHDEDGKILRIFPNRFARNPRIAAAKPLALPGTMGFELTAGRSGTAEQVACFATASDVLATIAPSIGGADLEPLSVKSLEQVRGEFVKTAGPNVGQATLSIRPQ